MNRADLRALRQILAHARVADVEQIDIDAGKAHAPSNDALVITLTNGRAVRLIAHVYTDESREIEWEPVP